MRISELKESLHEAIENIEDEKLFGIVSELMSEEYRSKPQFQLTERQWDEIKESEIDYQNGNFMSIEKANAIIDESYFQTALNL